MYRMPRVLAASVASATRTVPIARPASHLSAKVEATPAFSAAPGSNKLLLSPRLPPCALTPLSLRFCSTQKEQAKETTIQPDEVISDGEKAAAEEPPAPEKVAMVNDEKATGSSTTHEVHISYLTYIAWEE